MTALEEDVLISEGTVLGLAVILRNKDPISERHHEKWLKSIKSELQFLKENFPESEVLKQDFSDITG